MTDFQVSRSGNWIIRVPFSDLGKMEGEGVLAKKGVNCYLCGIWVHPTHFTTKYITPRISEFQTGWN